MWTVRRVRTTRTAILMKKPLVMAFPRFHCDKLSICRCRNPVPLMDFLSGILRESRSPTMDQREATAPTMSPLAMK
jgi:hypothetical protein